MGTEPTWHIGTRHQLSKGADNAEYFSIGSPHVDRTVVSKLPALLVVPSILLGLAACSGGGGDTATLSLDDYLAICSEAGVAEAVEISIEEFSKSVGEILERLESVRPPEEVANWHNTTRDMMQELKDEIDGWLDEDPEDRDPEEVFIFGTIFRLVPKYERPLRDAINDMPPDVRERMVAAGCIDTEMVDGASSPTGSTGTESAGETEETGTAEETSGVGDTADAEEIPVGGRVEGTVDEPGEADTYFFQAEAEQTYLIVATWETLPSIRLEVTDFLTFSRVREGSRQPHRVSWTAPESSVDYLLVSSGDDLGEGTGSYTVSILIEMSLLPPSDVRYAPEGSAIRINWDAVEGADYYNVYHSNFFDSVCTPREGGEAGFCENLALNVTETTYLHTEPDSETNYYWVAACNSQGGSEVDTSTPAPAVAPEAAAAQAATRTPEAAAPDVCQGSGSVASDRAALVALYNATDGANWQTSTNWLTDQPIGEWHGVTADGDGRVEWLDLVRNQLSGLIPVELCGLAHLERMDLGDNQLSGPIPAELGGLTHLELLYLHTNQLSGPIPAELGDLTNLESLYLHTNQLSGPIPVELGGLTDLELLYLHANQLSGPIPVELGGLSDLRQLHLHANQLSGPIPVELGGLSDLELLYLHANQLSGPIPAELGGLTNLRHLHLRANQLSGPIPAELGGLTNLELLYLHANQLSGPIPVELGGLTNLDSLRLWDNQLSGADPG